MEVAHLSGALLLVGFASALRRSEPVAVHVAHLTELAHGIENVYRPMKCFR